MANYSVENLKTVADCDAALAMAAQQQKDLDWKKQSLERQRDQYGNTSITVAAQLAAKEAEVAVYENIINGLPDGPVKEENIVKKTRAEYAVFTLSLRMANYGTVPYLGKEFNLQRVEKELEETAVFIAEVEARKANL